MAATFAVAFCLAAPPVAAEPFEAFIDLCIAPGVDRDAAGTLAKSAGWVELPAETFGGDDAPFEEARLYLSADPATISADKAADLNLLLTGSGAGDEMFGVKDVHVEICTVGALGGAEVSALAAQLGDYLGIEADHSVRDMPIWIFSPQGTGFRSRPELLDADDAAFDAAARQGKVLLATVMDQDGITVLAIGAIRPSNAD